MMVDPDGNPLPSRNPGAPPFEDPVASRPEHDGPGRDGAHAPGDEPERLDEEWLDRAINRNRPREPVPERRPRPPADRTEL